MKPSPPKELQRTHKLSFRVTETEYELLTAFFTNMGITQSEYLRQSALSSKVAITVRPIYPSEHLKKIASEYGKIGSNLNQIARYLNQDNPMTAKTLRDINRCLADLHDLKKGLEKMAGNN